MTPKSPFLSPMTINISKNLPLTGNATAQGYGMPLMAILIEAGRLTAEEAARIQRLQRERGLKFGEAALESGILTVDDLQFALARQFDYPYVSKDSSILSRELIAAFDPYSEHVEALRALRSHLMLRWFTGAAEHKALAIVSPSRREGRSYLAANLAIVFSQLGERTLLIDADMRHPRQHRLFELDGTMGLSSVLAGQQSMSDAIRHIPDLVDLWVLPAGTTPPNPQELLARGEFNMRLRELSDEYDAIIVDTPEIEGIADVHLIASATSAALMIAQKGRTAISSVGIATDALRQVGVTIVGSVLMTS